MERVITVEATGYAEVKPDLTIVILGLKTLLPVYEESIKLAAERYKSIVEATLKDFPEGISNSFLYTVFRFCGNSNKNRLMHRCKLIFFFLFHLIRRSRKSKKSEPIYF